ncbi:MAG TPA: ABC transporter permease [Solirubrobacteraceae bacterium]|jgi:ABC-type branched-subunit amino acid transport system permease subunit|nr:ABC transporter permease [Solirubrobacteraceae bacterium]
MSYLLFLLIGLGAGAVYALLALGLVLKHRSAGVVDFSHAAVAMFCAYVFLEMHNNGELVFPWTAIPWHLQLASSKTGAAVWVSVFVALAYSAVLGLIFYYGVVRPLRHAPVLARVCASVGLTLYLETVATLNFGTFSVSSPSILPSNPVHLASGLIVPAVDLYLAGIAIVVGLIFGAIYRYTRFGLATRAAAGNERGAVLIGLSATRLSAANWVLATVLASAAGILILPITTLSPSDYTLFIVPALGAALLGRFTSFPMTVAAGLAIGMLQSEIGKLQTVWTWLPQQGLQDGLPFILIMIAVVVFSKRLPSRGEFTAARNASIGRPRAPMRTTLISFAIGVVVILLVSQLYKYAFAASLNVACVCLSVVVITGYVGQISLAQNAFAGISAFEISHIGHGLGLGFPFALILGALCAVVVGVVIGLPAVRVRGVNLAIVTLSVATALDALVFNSTWFSGGYTGLSVHEPRLLGLNLGVSKGNSSTVFAIFSLAIFCLMAFLVARLRNAPAGRMFIAIRSNENAAAAVGVNVAKTKLFAFAISAFIAGIGGGLLAYQQININPASFTSWTSLTILAIAYVGGVGRIGGAVAAGVLLAGNGLMATLLNKLFDFNSYQELIAGLALMLTAIGNPDGIATEMQATYFKVLGMVQRRLGIDQVGGPPPAPPTVDVSAPPMQPTAAG